MQFIWVNLVCQFWRFEKLQTILMAPFFIRKSSHLKKFGTPIKYNSQRFWISPLKFQFSKLHFESTSPWHELNLRFFYFDAIFLTPSFHPLHGTEFVNMICASINQRCICIGGITVCTNLIQIAYKNSSPCTQNTKQTSKTNHEKQRAKIVKTAQYIKNETRLFSLSLNII